ncbi:hypothetical protein [Vibrio owensii]|uniref:hypothetical protein n=1 Tax=Vibrio owensii TaxID=696485 RepID=UPI0018F1B9FF|nr:hypothetical protein [Vibrio owensii]
MFLDKFEKKHLKQGALLASMTVVVGYLGVSFFSGPDDPRYKGAHSAQKPATSQVQDGERAAGGLFSSAPNVEIVKEQVDVFVKEEPPEALSVNFSTDSIDTDKVMSLYSDVRLNTVKLANRKLMKEIEDLDKPVSDEEVVADGIGFPMPETLLPIPQPIVEPVIEEQAPEEIEEDEFEPEPYFDPAVVFKGVSVSSMMVREGSVTAWLKVAGRSVRVYEGAYIGEFLVKKVDPEFILILHIPSDLERYVAPPGARIVSSAQSASTDSGGLVGQFVEPEEEQERVNYPTDDSGNAFAIDMPAGFVR